MDEPTPWEQGTEMQRSAEALHSEAACVAARLAGETAGKMQALAARVV